MTARSGDDERPHVLVREELLVPPSSAIDMDALHRDLAASHTDFAGVTETDGRIFVQFKGMPAKAERDATVARGTSVAEAQIDTAIAAAALAAAAPGGIV